VKTIPAEFRIDAHHWLILHGRYVCQARKPKCSECIIADLCEYKGKTWPALAPASGGMLKRQALSHGAAALSPTLPPGGGGGKRRAGPTQGD
jgi:endonuclease-3